MCDHPFTPGTFPNLRRGARGLPKGAALAKGTALAILVALGGCVSEEAKPPLSGTAAVTNQPVGQGVNVRPGSSEDFIVNVGRRIYFDADSAALNETARETLDNQARWLKQYPRYKVKIQGYADDSGGKSGNDAISLKRAQAAAAYLASQGVTGSRIKVKSYGNDKTRLPNDCADLECRSQNRHVRTVLVDDVGV